MHTQAPEFSPMSDISGTSKKEACEIVDKIEVQVGAAGMTQLMECGGEYPVAFRQLKAFCQAGRALSDSSADSADDDSGPFCNIAKAQVHLHDCMCANMTLADVTK